MSAKLPDSPYSDWVTWLDGFAHGTAGPGGYLVPLGDLRLGDYASGRAAERYVQAYNERADRWATQLIDGVKALMRRPDASLGPVFVDARRRLARLREEMLSAPVTERMREQAASALDSLVADAQRVLENELRRGPTGSTLLAQARRTPLTARPPSQDADDESPASTNTDTDTDTGKA